MQHSRIERRRRIFCLIIAAAVLGWAVLAFGTPMDFQAQGEVIFTPEDEIFVEGKSYPVRTVAIWLTGAGAVLCLLLWPGPWRLPRSLWPLGVVSGFLLLYGWFMVLNAVSDHSRETWEGFVLMKNRPFPWAPGTVARTESLMRVIELTAVLLAMWAAIRTARDSGWRVLLALISLFGFLVALIGMFHKAAGAEAIYFMDDQSQPSATLFAPFIYNANAGAFMNLSLAIAIGLALGRAGQERGRAAGIFWGLASVVLAAGVIVAASKGAIIALALTVVASLIWNMGRLRVLVRTFVVQSGRKIERIVLLVVLTTVLLSFAAIGVAYAVERWEAFAARFDDPARTDVTGRLEIMKLMIRMTGWEEGSWHGFGPGTFKHLVPYFTTGDDTPDSLDSRWLHGHCDPLQTLVEWGWVGAAGWFALGAGAVFCGLLLLRRRGLLAGHEVPVVRGVVIGLVVMGIHSFQDFPFSIYSIHLAAMIVCAVCWGLYAYRRSGVGRHASHGDSPARAASVRSRL